MIKKVGSLQVRGLHGPPSNGVLYRFSPWKELSRNRYTVIKTTAYEAVTIWVFDISRKVKILRNGYLPVAGLVPAFSGSNVAIDTVQSGLPFFKKNGYNS